MKRFAGLSATAVNLVQCVTIVCFAAAVLGIAGIYLLYPFEQPLPYLVGLAMGGALSVVKTVLLEKALNHSLEMAQKHASVYANAQFMLRYVLTIAVLVPVFLWPQIFGLFGTIAGILSLQIAAYMVHFFSRHKRTKQLP